MKGNNNVHAGILAAAGGYLLYLAWQQLEQYLNSTSELAPAVSILIIIVFTLGGLGTLYYAWTVYRQGKKTDDENEGETDQRKN